MKIAVQLISLSLLFGVVITSKCDCWDLFPVPECPPGLEFWCASACDQLCDPEELTTCHNTCTEGCYCPRGSIDIGGGVCKVKEEFCYDAKCPLGMHWNECGNQCLNECPGVACTPQECQPGCYCPDGMMLARNETNLCAFIDDVCPETTEVPELLDQTTVLIDFWVCNWDCKWEVEIKHFYSTYFIHLLLCCNSNWKSAHAKHRD